MSAPPRYPINRGLLASALDAQFTPSGSVAAQIAAALVPYSTTVQMQAAIDAAIAGTVTMGEVDTAIATALADYSTTTAMNTAISTALVGYSTTTQMNTAISTALTSYSTTTATNAAVSTYTSMGGLSPNVSLEITCSGGSGGTVTSGQLRYYTAGFPTPVITVLTAANTASPSSGQIGVQRTAAGTWRVYLGAGTYPAANGIGEPQLQLGGSNTPKFAYIDRSSSTLLIIYIVDITNSGADPSNTFSVRVNFYSAY